MIKIINKYMFTRKKVNAARRIAFGFMILILAGAILLMLPISSKSGETTPFFVALFTSTSATCVTGLVVVETGAYYSYFGQAVILALIQVGGLGFMLILTMAFLASKRHIGLRSRMVIAQSIGLNTMSGVVRIAKHTLLATAVIEGIGALLLAFRFVPQFGVKGIWYAVFHSISAFCNAGFDVFGDGTSLMPYRNDPLVLCTIAALILIGGLGFFVWENIITKRKTLSLYSKIVLGMTIFLVAGGTVIFFLLEGSNPDTIGNSDFFTKLLGSFFQAVTTRTAGFDAIGQNAITEPSKFFSVILMMIGGASGSTAGGVKTVTIAVIIMTLVCVLRGRNQVVILKRTIPGTTIIHAMTLLGLWLVITSVSAIVISCNEGIPLIDCMYEVASAYDTVGLSCGVMGDSNRLTQTIMIVLMYFGRVGIMTIGVTFMHSQADKGIVNYPQGSILIG